MINTLGKLLVLIHTVLSVAGLTWALVIFVQGRDFGWAEPAKEPIQFSPDGTPTKWIRHASQLDKSRAALEDAATHRDRHYGHVKPAIDSFTAAEPYLAANHLFYLEQRHRLKKGDKPIEVFRLENGGLKLEAAHVGSKPAFEIKPVEGITKTIEAYEAEWADLQKQIAAVRIEIDKINVDTRTFTTEFTGKDEMNKYLHPGLYDLIDLEYKAQTRYKEELEDVKPRWSVYLEQARQHMIRRTDLETQLQKLKTPPPKEAKKL